MKIISLISVVVCLFIFFSCNQLKRDSKAFVVQGKIDGSNTEYVILSYLDSSNIYVSDTLLVKNQSFYGEGSLINTHQVSLTSNLTGRYMEDPNRLMFFLEPNKIELILEEGQFDKAKIIGSKTQTEKENFDKKTKPFYDKIELIRDERQKLSDEKKEGDNKILEAEIDNLSKEWQKILNQVKQIRLEYALNNPSSYLSAHVVNIYRNSLPTDSLRMLYGHLDTLLKKSSYGLKIQELTELHIVDSGDVAPNFAEEDSDGNVLSLNQFKGKTVLLDFGAAWCVPCKIEIPEIKRIYDTYHSKGLEIIGISFDKDETSWKENIKNEKLNWHHIYEGRFLIEKEGSISKSYYVQPIPAYILIDKNGIIIDRYRGADKADKSINDLEEKLKTLLASN